VGKDGEARLQVGIAGDAVVVAGRSLFVPEAWQRAEAETESRQQILRLVSAGIIGALGLAVLGYAVAAWTRDRGDRRAALWVALIVFVTGVLGAVNRWPDLAFDLRTAEPVANQLVMSVLGPLAGGLVMALLFGLVAGVGMHYARAQRAAPLASRLPAWALGVAAACVTAGAAAALSAAIPATLPTWPGVRLASAAWPWAAALLDGASIVTAFAITLFLLAVVDRATSGWTRRLPLAAAALVLFAVALALAGGGTIAPALLRGALEGLASFGFAWLLLRYDLRSVPAFVAAGLVLGRVKAAGLAATSAAWLGCALTCVVIVALAVLATRELARGRG
jgi:hypothetical protein